MSAPAGIVTVAEPVLGIALARVRPEVSVV